MTYIVVGALTAMQILPWFGWFICEIIIHSLNSRHQLRAHYLQLLAEQSMQIYLYEGVILAGCTRRPPPRRLRQDPRGSRVANVHRAALLPPGLDLGAVLHHPNIHRQVQQQQRLRWHQRHLLLVDNWPAAPGGELSSPPELSTCRLAIAVASFAIIMEGMQCLIVVLYSFAQMLHPRLSLEDGTRKEIIEEDDAEVATVVASPTPPPTRANHQHASVSRISARPSSWCVWCYHWWATPSSCTRSSMIAVMNRVGFQVGSELVV